MTRGVVRRQDFCTGHACYPPRNPLTYSSNVYVNNLEVVRFGDLWQTHCCPGGGCHLGTSIGRRSINVNDRPIQIKYDPIDCGSFALTTSADSGN